VVTALACLTLAAGLLCLPASVASTRLGVLRPVRPDGRRWPRAVAPALLGALAGMLLLGPGGAIAGAIVVSTLRRARARRRATELTTTTCEQLADAVRRMTDELRAGGQPAAVLGGLDTDGPMARRLLTGAATAARLGDGVPEALRRAAAGRADVAADLERIARAWSLAERHGVPLADLLAKVHDDVRWRIRFAATVRAQLAGPAATAAILTALPALGLGLGQLIGADPVGVLRGGVLGQLLLVAGIGLITAGRAWSQHILRAAVPR
jgi:tight adherence protein B